MPIASRYALLTVLVAACSSPAEPEAAGAQLAPSPSPAVAHGTGPELPPGIAEPPTLGEVDEPSTAPVPRVHVDVPTVGPSGALSPEVIRRVVRRHINEIRLCFEQALATAPELAGRIETRWVIAPSGSVSDAAIVSSALASPAATDGGPPARAVEACVLAAIPRWTFPAPEGGGAVNVTYPFVFAMEAPAPPPSVGELPASPGGEGTIGLGNLGTVGS